MAIKKDTFAPGRFALKVRRSKTGFGLYAQDTIPRGACIIEYTGKPATKHQLDGDVGKYLFDTGAGTIDGYVRTNKARFINHSCTPNCEADGPKGRVFIMAKRTIQPGEELTYNYGKEYFDRYLVGICKCPKHAAAKQKNKNRR